MWAASYHSSSYRAAASVRSRTVTTLMAILVGVLLIFALLRLGGMPQFGKEGDGRPLTFEFLPQGDEAKPTRRAAAKAKPAAEKAAKPPAARAPVPQITPPLRTPAKLGPLEGVLNLSREDFAKTDVDKMRSRSQELASAGTSAGTSAAGVSGARSSTVAEGKGPAGQTLYKAEWYREPTDSQIAPYMTKVRDSGWGAIACQTIDRYHVDNCVELGETPGSGIAHGWRQAAWQFLVRPPTIDGKPQIGAWVVITYDLTMRIRTRP